MLLSLLPVERALKPNAVAAALTLLRSSTLVLPEIVNPVTVRPTTLLSTSLFLFPVTWNPCLSGWGAIEATFPVSVLPSLVTPNPRMLDSVYTFETL